MRFKTRVFNDRGVPIGTAESARELLDWQLKQVRDFLCKISKQTSATTVARIETKQTGEVKMSKTTTEQTNMAFIAGTIKTLKTRDDGSAFVLIDVGKNSKYIPCTVYDDHELTDVLVKFREDDFIQIQGFVRAWSQKKDDEWKNNVDVRITHVKNKPPIRESKRPEPKRAEYDDDKIPF